MTIKDSRADFFKLKVVLVSDIAHDPKAYLLSSGFKKKMSLPPLI